MPPQINLNELYQLKKKKDSCKIKSFDHILELCHKRIRNIAGYGGLNTFYEIPGMLLGFPLYNIHECMDYLVEKLRKNGFLIQILPPPHICVIYISWDPNELKPKKNAPLAIAPPPATKKEEENIFIPRFITKNDIPVKKK
jgi:hypothetical protein